MNKRVFSSPIAVPTRCDEPMTFEALEPSDLDPVAGENVVLIPNAGEEIKTVKADPSTTVYSEQVEPSVRVMVNFKRFSSSCLKLLNDCVYYLW